MEAQLSHDGLGLDAHMISGIVEEEHGAVLPAWVLSVENAYQVVEERGDHITVRGRMSQAEIDFTIIIKSRYHREPRHDSVQVQITLASSGAPDASDEAGLIQPRFVDVDDSFILLEQLNHSHCILLSQDHRFSSVGVDMQLLDFVEAEA